MSFKQCIDCPRGVLKHTSEFDVSRNGRTRDGLKATCKDCSKAKRRAWAAKNREREREWNAAKYEADPGYFVQNAARRRARLREVFVEDVDPSVVFEMHGGRCGICGEFISGKFHVDHVLPISKGGLHCYANTQPAHPFCNLSKKDKVLV